MNEFANVANISINISICSILCGLTFKMFAFDMTQRKPYQIESSYRPISLSNNRRKRGRVGDGEGKAGGARKTFVV